MLLVEIWVKNWQPKSVNHSGLLKLTIAKKMAACRFYRDPLRKVILICSKTVIKLIFYGIKISENKVLSIKTYVDKSNFSDLVLNII